MACGIFLGRMQFPESLVVPPKPPAGSPATAQPWGGGVLSKHPGKLWGHTAVTPLPRALLGNISEADVTAPIPDGVQPGSGKGPHVGI